MYSDWHDPFANRFSVLLILIFSKIEIRLYYLEFGRLCLKSKALQLVDA